jgi:hypothetical protein
LRRSGLTPAPLRLALPPSERLRGAAGVPYNCNMTIDERIEALTQSVELLSHLHQADHERIEALQDLADKIVTLQEKQLNSFANSSK